MQTLSHTHILSHTPRNSHMTEMPFFHNAKGFISNISGNWLLVVVAVLFVVVVGDVVDDVDVTIDIVVDVTAAVAVVADVVGAVGVDVTVNVIVVVKR